MFLIHTFPHHHLNKMISEISRGELSLDAPLSSINEASQIFIGLLVYTCNWGFWGAFLKLPPCCQTQGSYLVLIGRGDGGLLESQGKLFGGPRKHSHGDRDYMVGALIPLSLLLAFLFIQSTPLNIEEARENRPGKSPPICGSARMVSKSLEDGLSPRSIGAILKNGLL